MDVGSSLNPAIDIGQVRHVGALGGDGPGHKCAPSSPTVTSQCILSSAIFNQVCTWYAVNLPQQELDRGECTLEAGDKLMSLLERVFTPHRAR